MTSSRHPLCLEKCFLVVSSFSSNYVHGKIWPHSTQFLSICQFFWDTLYKYMKRRNTVKIWSLFPGVKIQIHIEHKYGQIRSSILPCTGHWLPSLTYVSQSLPLVHNLLLSTDTCMRTNIQIVLGNCEIVPNLFKKSKKYSC